MGAASRHDRNVSPWGQDTFLSADRPLPPRSWSSTCDIGLVHIAVG